MANDPEFPSIRALLEGPMIVFVVSNVPMLFWRVEAIQVVRVVYAQLLDPEQDCVGRSNREFLIDFLTVAKLQT